MNILRLAPMLSPVALLLLVSPRAALPQEQAPASVHWAYSAYFGTGWYTVPGDRDVFVVRMSYRHTLSDASFEADGRPVIGKYLRFPVSVGLNRFDLEQPLEAADPDNVSFLSVNPGIDIEVPVNDSWSLRPYAAVGYGRALGSNESALAYWGGVKSRVSFHADQFDWYLLNQVGFASYSPNEGPSDVILPVMAGVEAEFPIGTPADQAEQLLLHWRAAYWRFGDSLEFSSLPSGNPEIRDQFELGVALGKRQQPVRIWFLSFDRLGLGYRASSDGSLKGVTFIFRSLFDE
jgi:hypothetical protein